MNRAIIFSVLVVFFWLPYFTRSETAPNSVDKSYYGQRKFFVDLLHAFQKVQPNETLFFSPHSIFRALLLKYLIAEGDVEKLLKKTLQLDWAKSKADVSHAYELEKLARANCRENQTVEFNSIDKLYFSNQVKLNDNLKEMLIDSIEVLNFAFEPEEARFHINKFVEETTKGIIKDLLPSEYISHDTIYVLVNAAFFKGDWASPFEKEATKKKFFYKNIHTPVYVEMMEQKGWFNYGVIHELNTQFVEIPYSGENEKTLKKIRYLGDVNSVSSVSMYVFLPNAIDEFLENVTPEMLDQVFVDGESQHKRLDKVNIELPKIALKQKIKLMPVFAHIAPEVFSDNSDAIHQANIDIDEGGTVAAAASSVFTLKVMVREKKFICNRPFMFLIHDKKSKEVLFAGVYRGPINNINLNVCQSHAEYTFNFSFSS